MLMQIPNNIIFHDVGALPGGQLDAQANILIVEKPQLILQIISR